MSEFSNQATDEVASKAYVQAILGLLGDRDPLEVLATTPDGVERALAGLSEEQLRTPEAPGKWSLVEVVMHLADSEVAGAWRMRLVAAQDRPRLTGYDQDLWAEHMGYRDGDPAEALLRFRVLRQSNVRLLRSRTPEQLQRVGIHEERGEESLAHLARLYAGHDLVHLRQIDRIRKVLAAGGAARE